MNQQFCTFRIDGHLFGVPVADVQEVLREQETTPVPAAPPEVYGLLNLRGQIVTTIDLRTRLGIAPAPAGISRVNVVVRTTDGAVSLLVDQIGDVLTPPDSCFEPVPDTVPAHVGGLVRRVGTLEKDLLLVLDTELAATVSAAPVAG